MCVCVFGVTTLNSRVKQLLPNCLYVQCGLDFSRSVGVDSSMCWPFLCALNAYPQDIHVSYSDEGPNPLLTLLNH